MTLRSEAVGMRMMEWNGRRNQVLFSRLSIDQAAHAELSPAVERLTAANLPSIMHHPPPPPPGIIILPIPLRRLATYVIDWGVSQRRLTIVRETVGTKRKREKGMYKSGLTVKSIGSGGTAILIPYTTRLETLLAVLGFPGPSITSTKT